MGHITDLTMIGWLQGALLERWQEGSRCGVLLACSGVGYEVQLCRRVWEGLPDAAERLTLHVHTLVRDDGWALFGFEERLERDLFRALIGVSGVGPQMAVALQGEMTADALVGAIIAADLRSLCRAPGVGKRTAERLSVELRERLARRFRAPGEVSDLPDGGQAPPPPDRVREEVRQTLQTLGYDTLEIQRSLRAVAALPDLQGAVDLPGGGDAEIWIREALRWLGREAA
jgi:Holliday junction DNA helicase RuvA